MRVISSFSENDTPPLSSSLEMTPLSVVGAPPIILPGVEVLPPVRKIVKCLESGEFDLFLNVVEPTEGLCNNPPINFSAFKGVQIKPEKLTTFSKFSYFYING